MEVAEFVKGATVPIILVLILVHHVLETLDRYFGGPRFLVGFLHRHRVAQIREVLKEIGFDEEERKKAKAFRTWRRVGSAGRYVDAHARCMSLLKSCVWKRTVTVGSGDAVDFPYYIDLMSESLDPDRAEESARILASHVKSTQPAQDYAFDAVIGLKLGSPLVAAAFSEKVRKPLLLFRGRNNYKVASDGIAARYLFDGPLTGKQSAVLVDDSTTGGTLALDCIEAASEVGISIRQCWVLFEPMGKQAREKLKAQGVELVSVVQMTPDVVTQVLK